MSKCIAVRFVNSFLIILVAIRTELMEVLMGATVPHIKEFKGNRTIMQEPNSNLFGRVAYVVFKFFFGWYECSRRIK